MSVESTWSLLGLLDRDQILDNVASSSVATETTSSSSLSATLLEPFRSRSASPPSPLTDAAKTRSSVIGGLDIHSCLQFLLDLYGQVLSPLATPRTPLMQLNATIRSVGSVAPHDLAHALLTPHMPILTQHMPLLTSHMPLLTPHMPQLTLHMPLLTPHALPDPTCPS